MEPRTIVTIHVECFFDFVSRSRSAMKTIRRRIGIHSLRFRREFLDLLGQKDAFRSMRLLTDVALRQLFFQLTDFVFG